MHQRCFLRPVVLLAMAAILVACGSGTTGSGNLLRDERDVAAFDRITVEDGLQLRLTLSAGEATEVVVTFDDNLLEHIETTVRDGTLEIRVDGELSADGGGRFVSVVVGELSSVEASGGAALDGEGRTESLSVEATGGANVDLRDLEVAELQLDASGGANVNVLAPESVTGKASGGARVRVHGDPVAWRIETSGGADVDFS